VLRGVSHFGESTCVVRAPGETIAPHQLIGMHRAPNLLTAALADIAGLCS
jgi:hypothetical protein